MAENDSFIRDKFNHGVACLSGSRQAEGVASDTPRVLAEETGLYSRFQYCRVRLAKRGLVQK